MWLLDDVDTDVPLLVLVRVSRIDNEVDDSWGVFMIVIGRVWLGGAVKGAKRGRIEVLWEELVVMRMICPFATKTTTTTTTTTTNLQPTPLPPLQLLFIHSPHLT